MKTPFKIGLLAAALGLITACAPPGAPYYHTQNGALMGATAGAVIGHQLDHRNGAVAGGLEHDESVIFQKGGEHFQKQGLVVDHQDARGSLAHGRTSCGLANARTAAASGPMSSNGLR